MWDIQDRDTWDVKTGDVDPRMLNPGCEDRGCGADPRLLSRAQWPSRWPRWPQAAPSQCSGPALLEQGPSACGAVPIRHSTDTVHLCRRGSQGTDRGHEDRFLSPLFIPADSICSFTFIQGTR